MILQKENQMTHQERQEQKRKHWQKKINEFISSGMTATEFAKSQGISVHQFHYWKAKLVIGAKSNTAPTTKSEPTALIKVVQKEEPGFCLPNPRWLAEFIKALHE